MGGGGSGGGGLVLAITVIIITVVGRRGSGRGDDGGGGSHRGGREVGGVALGSTVPLEGLTLQQRVAAVVEELGVVLARAVDLPVAVDVLAVGLIMIVYVRRLFSDIRVGICAYLEDGSIVGGRVTSEVSVTSSCGSVREDNAVDGGDSRESE